MSQKTNKYRPKSGHRRWTRWKSRTVKRTAWLEFFRSLPCGVFYGNIQRVDYFCNKPIDKPSKGV